MQIAITQKQHITIIQLDGRLDGVTMGQLEEQLLLKLEQGNKHLLFQLQNLEYISSAGLRVMLLAIKKTKAVQGAVAICELQSNVKDIFDLSGFSSIFHITATLDEALAYLQAQG